MKKILIIIGIIAVILFLSYFVGFGFQKLSSAYILNYEVAEDGSQMTVRIINASSIGFVRKAVVRKQQDETLYVDCYHAFGGLNGKIGACDTFTFSLDASVTKIALYRNANYYEVVLEKDENGVWNRK